MSSIHSHNTQQQQQPQQQLNDARASQTASNSNANKRKKVKVPVKQRSGSITEVVLSGMPAIEGWLTKRGGRNKRSWKTRWFQAYPGPNGVIIYYKGKENPKPLGSIDLANATVRPANANKDVALFVIITQKRVWELAASSYAVMERWLNALGYSEVSRADELIREAEQMILSLSTEMEDRTETVVKKRHPIRFASSPEERNGQFAKRLSRLNLPETITDYEHGGDGDDKHRPVRRRSSSGAGGDEDDESSDEDNELDNDTIPPEGDPFEEDYDLATIAAQHLQSPTSPERPSHWPPPKAAAMLGLLERPGMDF